MKTKLFALVHSALFLCACAPIENKRQQVEQSPPNILLIVADDLGYGDLGVYGQNKILTPNIDQLAKQGIQFNQAYAGAPVCGPSRASLFTGLHTGHSPIRGNPKWTKSGQPVDLNKQDITFAKVLKEAGYNTGLVGKWGLAEHENAFDAMPNQQGFDFFYGYKKHNEAHHYYWNRMFRNNDLEMIEGNDYKNKVGKYTHDLFTQEAKQFIERQNTRPWFLMLSYTIPHLEVTVPEDSKLPYKALDWKQRKMHTSGHYKNDAEGNTAYAGMVSRMDRDVGSLVDLLKAKGLAENTIVIFTSDNGHEYDNGFFNSNGPLKGRKRDLYEGGIRMPFIAWWPGKIKPLQRSDHIMAFWDIMPTFCDLANTSCPTNDGISIVPTLLNKASSQKQHDYLYWEFNERKGPVQAIRKENWKLVKFLNKPAELYDLSKDIAENNDVALQHPIITKKLVDLLAVSRTEHPEFTLEPRVNMLKPKT